MNAIGYTLSEKKYKEFEFLLGMDLSVLSLYDQQGLVLERLPIEGMVILYASVKRDICFAFEWNGVPGFDNNLSLIEVSGAPRLFIKAPEVIKEEMITEMAEILAKTDKNKNPNREQNYDYKADALVRLTENGSFANIYKGILTQEDYLFVRAYEYLRTGFSHNVDLNIEFPLS